MFNGNGGYSLSDIAAVSGAGNRGGFGGFGDDGWWIILLFLFGWGGNGWTGFWLWYKESRRHQTYS